MIYEAKSAIRNEMFVRSEAKFLQIASMHHGHKCFFSKTNNSNVNYMSYILVQTIRQLLINANSMSTRSRR